MKKTLIQAMIFLLIIAAIAAILFPLFPQPHRGEGKLFGLSNIKQLGTAIAIYNTDYDDRYPHATAMPGLRASIIPYCKNNSLFQSTTQSGVPEFNFNYAGALSYQPPIGFTDLPNPKDTTVWYALSKINDKPGVIRSHSDSSAKYSQLSSLFQSFQYQFDRSDISLAPTDYLENEDPMKGVKVQIQTGNK